MNTQRKQRITRVILGILAVLTLSGQILEAERAPKLPAPTMTLRDQRVLSLVAGGAAERAGVRVGDIICMVGSMEVTPARGARALLKRFETGDEIRLTLLRDGQSLRVSFIAPAATQIDILWRYAIAGVGILTVLIGIVTYYKKPRQLTLIFAGVCFSMGYLVQIPYVPPLEWMLLARDVFLDGLSFLFPPLFVHLFLLFPFRHAILERRPRFPFLLYLPSLLMIFVFQSTQYLLPGFYRDHSLYELSHMSAVAVWVAGIGGGLWLFVRSYRRARSEILRAKVRVVLWGTALGLLPIVLVLIEHQLRPERTVPGERLAGLSIVLIPLSFGYAIVRHGIFDATHIVRRSLGFTVLAALILVTYFGAYLMLRELLTPWRQISPLWISFLSMLAVGVALLMVQGHLQALFRKAGGTERRDHHRFHYDLVQALSGLRDREPLVRVITEFTGEALSSRRVAFFEAIDGGSLEATYLDGVRIQDLCRHRISSNLSRKLEGITEPIDRGDLETDLPFGYMSPSDHEIFQALNTQVIVPLRSKEALRGLLFVGDQMLGEPFTADDLRLAETVATEGNIALENSVLQERAKEGDQWRREVDVARDLQERLLPNQMPQVESLEISGFSIPAKGVGGDYFDCFRTPWGEIVLAIGDASGKWVSGAILMANLQGLVKGESNRREGPAKIVGRINRRFSEMNKPERYITFCLARIDPLTGVVAYCNAGHPSMLLVRAGGDIEELTLGGLPLGIRSHANYIGGSSVMHAGDLLLLYTDGITERQRGEELFGEERLQKIILKHQRLSARALQELVLATVQDFAPTPLDDDTTLLLVKML
ncbi:MAG: SpoIIE family protein phosphatase [Candidatus Eisenbacteria sp.]|nr:SpoIIE family protein phosphatase [Candidatus Eisenbacteria bacterium]